MGIFLWERSCEMVAQGCASASVGGVLLLFLEVLPRQSWRQAQGTPCTARLQRLGREQPPPRRCLL